jgi:hypothetical protein
VIPTRYSPMIWHKKDNLWIKKTKDSQLVMRDLSWKQKMVKRMET